MDGSFSKDTWLPVDHRIILCWVRGWKCGWTTTTMLLFAFVQLMRDTLPPFNGIITQYYGFNWYDTNPPANHPAVHTHPLVFHVSLFIESKDSLNPQRLTYCYTQPINNPPPMTLPSTHHWQVTLLNINHPLTDSSSSPPPWTDFYNRFWLIDWWWYSYFLAKIYIL